MPKCPMHTLSIIFIYLIFAIVGIWIYTTIIIVSSIQYLLLVLFFIITRYTNICTGVSDGFNTSIIPYRNIHISIILICIKTYITCLRLILITVRSFKNPPKRDPSIMWTVNPVRQSEDSHREHLRRNPTPERSRT